MYRENSLERTRLVSDPDITPEVKSTPMKSLVWFFIVVLLALVTYLGLKTFLTGNTDDTVEPTVTPTTALVDDGILSVSYTHLKYIFLPKGVYPIKNTIELGANTPVSYTHLDVYKRQETTNYIDRNLG